MFTVTLAPTNDVFGTDTVTWSAADVDTAVARYADALRYAFVEVYLDSDVAFNVNAEAEWAHTAHTVITQLLTIDNERHYYFTAEDGTDWSVKVIGS